MSWNHPHGSPQTSGQPAGAPGDWRGAYREAFERVPRPPRAPTPLARDLIFAYQGTQAVLRIIGIIFLAIGIIFPAIFAGGVPVDIALSLAGSRVQGTAISAELNRNVKINGRRPMRITFRYEIDGRTYQGDSSTLDSQIITAAYPGASIPIEALPWAPGWARIPGTTYSTFGYVGLFTLIFPAVGGGLLFAAVRSNRREIRAYRRGLPTQGLVVKKGYDTSTKINGRHPFEVVWELQVDGQTYKGSLSHMNRELLERAIPSNEITVLYDPADPSANTVWIEG